MGTPEFAVAPLDALVQAGHEIVAVVTAPDKPAGRGKQIRSSAVKDYSTKHLDCPVLQPENLKDRDFIARLEGLDAQLFVVVAFRMLPEAVWSIPKFGTFNLHASLLPQYRGAAPINWCLINGEEQTGVTTFLIDHMIDTGKILLQESISIEADENAGSLHDKLMVLGAALVVKTVEKLMQGELRAMDQSTFRISPAELKPAPKIFKEDCKIDWNKSAREIHNLIRGLSPFPGAYTIFKREGSGEEMHLKIFASAFSDEIYAMAPGTISTDGRSHLSVYTAKGRIDLRSLQLAGKARMQLEDFLRGFKGDLNAYRAE